MLDATPLIVLGAATALHEISDLVGAINNELPRFKIEGALDDNTSLHGSSVAGIEVLGGLSLAKQQRDDVKFVFAISSYGLRTKRIDLFERLGLTRDQFPSLIHPQAAIAASARIGQGCAIFGNAAIAPHASVGDFSVIYNSAFVSAAAELDDFSLVAALAFVGANARLGKGAFVAGNATVAPGVKIGAGSMVALSSVAFKDVPSGTTVLGNPAQPHRKTPESSEPLTGPS